MAGTVGACRDLQEIGAQICLNKKFELTYKNCSMIYSLTCRFLVPRILCYLKSMDWKALEQSPLGRILSTDHSML